MCNAGSYWMLSSVSQAMAIAQPRLREPKLCNCHSLTDNDVKKETPLHMRLSLLGGAEDTESAWRKYRVPMRRVGQRATRHSGHQ